MSRKESTEQIILVARIRQFYPGIVVFAIPNGGNRSITEATRLKAEGVLAGVPDLMVAHATQDWNGLFIELKRAKGGTVSARQKAMMSRLENAGYCCLVAHGAEHGWQLFESYMNGEIL